MLASAWENANCHQHYICILTGQCACTLLRGSAQSCSYAKQRRVCSLQGTVVLHLQVF